MHSWRVTKYDPAYRDTNTYTKEEWTAASDIGRAIRELQATRADPRTGSVVEALLAELRQYLRVVAENQPGAGALNELLREAIAAPPARVVA